MTRKRWILLGGALIGLFALAFALRPAPVLAETGTVRRGTFTWELVADGRTRVRERHVIASPIAGELLRPTLRAGDGVRKGDLLAVIVPGDPGLLDARAERELRERLGVVEAALARARAVQAQAEASLAHARMEEGRATRLQREGALSTQERDKADLTLRLALRDQEAAAFQSHAAEHEVSQARAALARFGGPTRGSRWEVRAPVAGTVLRILKESEGPVALGTPLLELGWTRDLEVVMDLPTEDAAPLREGAPARLERWGGPPLAARVRRVEPSAFTKVSPLGIEEQRVNVVLDLPDPPPTLGDAYQGEVRVLLERVESALILPSSALFRDGEGWAVYRIASGRARTTAVQVARRGPLDSHLLSGLQEGDRVVLYPSDAVREGVRIRTP